jgi:OOP family OmpA-OmpF porin
MRLFRKDPVAKKSVKPGFFHTSGLFRGWRVMHNIKACTLIAAALLVAGCASSTPKADSPWLSKPVVYADSFSPPHLESGRAGLVLYRPHEAVQEGNAKPINVFVAGSYVTSLLPGGFTVVSVCPGVVKVAGYALAAEELRAVDSLYVHRLTAVADQSSYFEIAQSRVAGDIDLRQTSAKEAASARLQQQSHTIPRLTSLPCPAPAPVVAPVPPPALVAVVPAPQPEAQTEKRSLSADTLFIFGKGGKADLVRGSRVKISALATQLQHDYQRIDHIEVVGHSDPVGSVATNQKLSLQRASTVAGLLQEDGIGAGRISASGKGASELAVASCRQKSPKARNRCNQPNRRVELLITGVRR